MLWPNRIEYTQAVRDYPHVSLRDPDLRGGKVKVGKDNFLLSYAGGFSIVFPINVVSKTFALRCWTQEVDNAQVRYQKISDYLGQVSLPWFVDFKYAPEGIMVMGKKYPITRMEWVEGETLRDFIAKNLQTPNIFRTVADDFQKMVTTLHDHQISHGDLQDGNILIKRNGAAIEIKLIDYDSLSVPALHGQPEQIVGLPEYQHPQRIAGGGKASEKVDYFSELVIYLSFLSIAEKSDLWTQFADAKRVNDGLLFSKEDFENPNQSGIFQELEKLSPDIQQLTATLKDFCAKTSIDQLEPLEAILPKPDANKHIDQGNTFLNNGRYNEALAEFQKAISINRNNERAYFGRGHVYRRTQRYTDAINAFQQAIQLKSDYKEAYHGLGIAYFESGNNSKAIEAVNEALRIDPDYQPASTLLETIKSTTRPPVRPPKPAPPDDPTPDPVSPPNPRTNVWQILTVLLGIGLVLCVVGLTTQIGEKNNALFEVGELKRQQINENSKIQNLTADVQTLKQEKSTLSSENRQLKNHLAEKDIEIQRLNSRIRALELLSQNSRSSGSSSPEITEMTLIPAGEFRMGSNAASAYSDEKPMHTVYIDAFYIDKHEVTNEEYKKFVDANPQWRKGRILRKYHDGDYLKHWTGNSYSYGKGDHPVTWVSWYAAMAYAQWKGKRLPTEAEWEKAARGGLASNVYFSGNLINFQTANYDSNVGNTTPVGNYLANPYGIYDIIGNVSEWCLDAYGSNFYANSPRRNPVAGGSIYSIVRDFKNLKADRVLRGGSWSSNINRARVAYRFSISPTRTNNTTGFRCVKPANL